MSIDNLGDIYIDQLKDIYSANKQSAKVTEELADAASNEELKEALKKGVEGIRDGMEKVAEIVRGRNEDPDGEHCKGMEGLVEEARSHALEEEFGDDDAQDAMIITQYQRMAHYAIAGYGCVAAFARRLDMDDEADTIEACLDACYEGDRKMTDIARSDVNRAAA